jgi:hypothetical protein
MGIALVAVPLAVIRQGEKAARMRATKPAGEKGVEAAAGGAGFGTIRNFQ